MDERFVMHRFQSTRLAMIVGVVLMAAWINYEWFVSGRLRIDLLVILAAIALTKVAAMLYYQFVH
jgi:hypothetical protein